MENDFSISLCIWALEYLVTWPILLEIYFQAYVNLKRCVIDYAYLAPKYKQTKMSKWYMAIICTYVHRSHDTNGQDDDKPMNNNKHKEKYFIYTYKNKWILFIHSYWFMIECSNNNNDALFAVQSIHHIIHLANVLWVHLLLKLLSFVFRFTWKLNEFVKCEKQQGKN